MDKNIPQKEEIWKSLADFENIYEISNYGRIRRIKGFWCKKNRIKLFSISNAGYYRVKLEKHGVGKKYCVHRLVASVFLKKNDDPSKKQVNHIDGDKLNNHSSNLEYMSHSENQKHAYKIGLQKIKKGSARINVAKLDENKVIEIRNIYASGNVFMKDLAKKYNVSETTINFIINRKRWTHI